MSINETLSKEGIFEYGILWGSVLRQSLITIYISDLFFLESKGKHHYFDDGIVSNNCILCCKSERV